MFNINCATARHLKELADIPKELAKKIVKYRKKRKRIRHIDELWRIRGISRRYFASLVKMFYVPNQTVPKIGEPLPYINTMSTLTIASKPVAKKSRSKKRKPKIKKKHTSDSKNTRTLPKALEEKAKIENPEIIKAKEMKKQESTSDDSSTSFGVSRMIDFPTKSNIGESNMKDFRTTSGFGVSNIIDFPTTSGIGVSNIIDFPTNPKSQGAGRIAKWISSIPKFNFGHKSDKKHVQISNDDKYYSYYFKESEKQESSIGKVKKSSQIFFQKKMPESEHAVNLYKSCTIL
ncbi:unnamed protein product [Mytilus coruscus]|uniref:Uncharacterized protein n=1 Tax=Mytilus coruscus TaxID=42192 RepID=A0A6J8CGH7_MYTCO|nr:unnamed protein product [Mytilus coruscus]